MANEEYLIHFTSFDTNYKKFDDRDGSGVTNLLGIIENGFKFNARRTYIPRPLDHTPSIELRVGMICFAEISLKDIVENKDKFGKVGICMKKSGMVQVRLTLQKIALWGWASFSAQDGV